MSYRTHRKWTTLGPNSIWVKILYGGPFSIIKNGPARSKFYRKNGSIFHGSIFDIIIDIACNIVDVMSVTKM